MSMPITYLDSTAVECTTVCLLPAHILLADATASMHGHADCKQCGLDDALAAKASFSWVYMGLRGHAQTEQQ
jgi:hypothetical protein